MAIKIDWQDLQKRYLGWQEVVKVMLNGGEIRPNTVPPVPKPWLCFTANTSGSTISLGTYWSPEAVTLETSTDWSNWSIYTIWDTITLSNVGDTVYWRNTSETDTRFSISGWSFYHFNMSWSISAGWDITYLLNKNSTNTLSNNCFESLFSRDTALTTAPQLPATTLAGRCYLEMFIWCSNLVTAPALPATTLAGKCYSDMFSRCTSLIATPQLPATTLADWCYSNMFYWCTNLVTATDLPAADLPTRCYYNMFYGCSSLTTLPSIHATTAALYSCAQTFRGCSKIKLSKTQEWEYQTPYRIPPSWTLHITIGRSDYMFNETWWSFAWTPNSNTTYYTSNTVI